MIAMKRFSFVLAFLLVAVVCSAQKVSNARFEQVDKTIKIYYDLSDKADISIYLSTDGGRSFETTPLTNVWGDVGNDVKSGKGKVAVWDVLTSREKLQGERICFKVRANSSISNLQYVDLGLPSGTRWAQKNEKGFYSYDEAVRKFGDRLPTKEQSEELKDMCSWSWNGSGYKVTGPNGKSIVLPSDGYRTCDGSVYNVGTAGDYWSSSHIGSDNAWYLNINARSIFNLNRCFGFSVRLVQD